MKTLAVMTTLALACVGQTPTPGEFAALDQSNQEAYRITQLQLQVLYGQMELIRLKACLVAHYTMEECGQIGADQSGRTVVYKIVQKPASSKQSSPTSPPKK